MTTFAADVLQFTAEATGIPAPTIKDWIKEKERIIKAHNDKKLIRKKRRIGSGRKPMFPKVEKTTADFIRQLRSQCRIVSKQRVLQKLKEEAEKENLTEYRRSKWYVASISLLN